MGKSSCIAVKGATRAEILRTLGLVETGELDFIGEAHLVCAELQGWVVLSTNHEFDFAEGKMSALSARGEAIACQSYDVVMYSKAEGYRAGEQVWSVVHNPDVGPRSLELEGAPPPEFAAVRDRLMREQDEHEGEEVDYIFDVPSSLVTALCGFSPEAHAAPDTLFRVVAPARSGKAGERQAADRALSDALTSGVETQLFPALAALGFEPVLGHPDFHKFYRRGVGNAFVRRSGDLSESVEVNWAVLGAGPQIGFDFFVRRGAEPRYGRSGSAAVRPRPPTLLERFTGRKPPTPADVAQALEDALSLLPALDRHLRQGAVHPNIRPPVYWDERSGAATA